LILQRNRERYSVNFSGAIIARACPGTLAIFGARPSATQLASTRDDDDDDDDDDEGMKPRGNQCLEVPIACRHRWRKVRVSVPLTLGRLIHLESHESSRVSRACRRPNRRYCRKSYCIMHARCHGISHSEPSRHPLAMARTRRMPRTGSRPVDSSPTNRTQSPKSLPPLRRNKYFAPGSLYPRCLPAVDRVPLPASLTSGPSKLRTSPPSLSRLSLPPPVSTYTTKR